MQTHSPDLRVTGARIPDDKHVDVDTLYETFIMFPPSGRLHFRKRTFAPLGGLLHAALVLTFLGIAIEQPAAAYTDPGSGAFILQMIAASVVGGLFYFRKFFAFFRRSPKDPKEPNE